MAYTTIDDSELYFQVVTYTGSGSSHAITLGGSVDLSPDLVIIKGRAATSTTSFFDTVRGATKQLATSRIGGNAQGTVAESLKSFDSDGFTVGTDGDVNYSGDGYVAWCFLESATPGFDIVTWTVPASGSTTISHSLSAVPKMIISKSTDTGNTDWETHHNAIGNANTVQLNTTAALGDNNAYNDTDPTSSVFTIGSDNTWNSPSIVFYCFADVKGYSKFGSYTGNGSTDGTFVYTGFKPAWVLIKNSGRASTSWTLYDNKRPGYNEVGLSIRASQTHTESTASGYPLDILSNGFKIRTSNAALGGGADPYIYMAFDESPFVNSKGIPNNGE